MTTLALTLNAFLPGLLAGLALIWIVRKPEVA